MSRYIKVGVGLFLVSFGLYFFYNNNKISDKQMINHKEKISDKSDIVENKLPNPAKITNPTNKIKKLKYTKVALPDDIRKIEHQLVDIQNGIEQDKSKLDMKAKLNLSNNDIDEEIKKTDQLINKLNKEIKLPKDKIEKLNNSYMVVLNSPITTPGSKKVKKELFYVDKKILKLEKDFELLHRGEVQ